MCNVSYLDLLFSFYRASKTSARKLISDSLLTTPQGKGDGGDSDDSLVGDHSPFVRQTAKRYSCPQYYNYTRNYIYYLCFPQEW